MQFLVAINNKHVIANIILFTIKFYHIKIASTTYQLSIIVNIIMNGHDVAAQAVATKANIIKVRGIIVQ